LDLSLFGARLGHAAGICLQIAKFDWLLELGCCSSNAFADWDGLNDGQQLRWDGFGGNEFQMPVCRV
jgi:hypothetical protein